MSDREVNLGGRLIIWAGLASAALLAAAGATAQAGQAGQPAPPSALPAGPGRDTLLRVCSSCHSPEIVARQRLSANGWKSVVETMANNGAVATDAELAEITAYLVRSFSSTDAAPGA